MVLLGVEQLKPGMVLAQNIYDVEGRLLLSGGTVLGETTIRRLAGLGFRMAYVLEDQERTPENDALQSLEETRREVRRALQSVTARLADIRAAVEAESLRWAVELLVQQITQRPEVLMALVDVKAIPDHSFGHSISVAVVAVLLGRELSLDQGSLRELGLGALLHDLGKAMVPFQILNKADRLSDEEFQAMRAHAETGYRVLQGLGFAEPVARVALEHHERLGGQGYPRGLRGERIGIYARIVAVADVFDAMTSDRPYKTAMHPHEALSLIMEESGTAFDPRVVAAAGRVIAPYPVGSLVRLTDGRLAVVRAIHPGGLEHPEVRIYRNRNGRVLVPPVDLDLRESGLAVARAIPWYEVPVEELPPDLKRAGIPKVPGG